MPAPRIGITSEPVVHDGRLMTTVNRVYIDAVVAAGGVPTVVPVLDPALAEVLLDGMDGLVLSGGGDIDPARYGQRAAPEVGGVDPARDASELALVRGALERRMPVLGVCRGHQLLNVALGGSLIQHIGELASFDHQQKGRPSHVVHEVNVAAGSLLAEVMGCRTLGVNTLHHQVVAEAGAGLQVVARCTDGLIEAVEGLGDLRVLGVQWHPELLAARDAHGGLFRWLVSEAGAVEPVAELEVVPSPSPESPSAPARSTRSRRRRQAVA